MAPTLQRPAAVRNKEARGEDYCATIRALIASQMPPQHQPERRQEHRYPYPKLVTLLPVAEDDLLPLAEPLTVVGTFLSEHGFGFYHRDLLPHRYVIATLETGDAATALRLLVDVRWCRSTTGGWYQSGGEFLGRVMPGTDDDGSLELFSFVE